MYIRMHNFVTCSHQCLHMDVCIHVYVHTQVGPSPLIKSSKSTTKGATNLRAAAKTKPPIGGKVHMYIHTCVVTSHCYANRGFLAVPTKTVLKSINDSVIFN